MSVYLYIYICTYIYIYIYTNYIILSFSISFVYPSKQTHRNFIQYAKWSVNQDASFLFLYIFCLYLYLYIYIYRIKKKDIYVHSLHNFILQYFRCLPLKTNTYEFHPIRKMISESRRILLVFNRCLFYLFIFLQYIFI